jgi:DNA-binding response OmpR family regulator
MAGRILLVDDDPVIADALARILTLAGYAVGVAGDGVEALERARREAFDVFVLDLAMPRLDGLKTLRYLRQVLPAARVVILAAHISPQDQVAALRYGAAIVLVKPPDLDELLAVVERLVDDGEPPASEG